METGIQVSSLRPLLTSPEQVETAFRKLRSIGCQTVQLQWIDPAVAVETIAEITERTGLQSVSVQDFYETVRTDPDYYIRLNALTGGEWCCVSRIPVRFRTKEGMAECVREFRTFADTLEKHQQRLCFHPVTADYQNYDGIVPVDELLENMPEMQLCLDLYHLNRSGRKMTDWIEAHAGRICMVHFKDEKDGVLVPSGQGSTDWSGVARACEKAGTAYAFVEQETWTRDPFECLQEAFAWLNGQSGSKA